MENGTEKVCRRCGTLNNARSLMCMRCGETLEIEEEQKYNIFKERLLSGKLFSFLFIVLFTAYLYGMIFYASPWIYNKIYLLKDTFIFEFYDNPNLTHVILETIYTLCLFLANSISISLILEMIIGTKLFKSDGVKVTCLFTCLYTVLSVVLITIYKYKLNYIVILEHLVSIIVVLPYIKRKLFKRSI